jgi:hypothetical protein
MILLLPNPHRHYDFHHCCHHHHHHHHHQLHFPRYQPPGQHRHCRPSSETYSPHQVGQVISSWFEGRNLVVAIVGTAAGGGVSTMVTSGAEKMEGGWCDVERSIFQYDSIVVELSWLY